MYFGRKTASPGYAGLWTHILCGKYFSFDGWRSLCELAFTFTLTFSFYPSHPSLFPIGLFWKMADRGQPICLTLWYRISSLEPGQVERWILGSQQHRDPFSWPRSQRCCDFWIINSLVFERGTVFKSRDLRTKTTLGSVSYSPVWKLRFLGSSSQCRSNVYLKLKRYVVI